MAQAPAGKARPAFSVRGPAARVAEVVMASLSVTVEQVGIVVNAANGATPGATGSPALTAPCAPAQANPSDTSRIAERDPLVARAKEYASGSLRVLQVLRSQLMRGEDETMRDAADRLEETCITVASKIHRAVSSATESEEDRVEPQGDANGSAKVALLLIEESRQAWRELMRPGRSVGNGAPARFILTLDTLESGLHDRFPRALEFVRPGFDTLDEGVPGQVARALLNAQVTSDN